MSETKKVVYLLVLTFLFPPFVFSAANLSRSSEVTSLTPLTISVSVDNYDEDINCGGLQFWGIQAIEHETGRAFLGEPRFVPSSVLSQAFLVDLPSGSYEEITFICSGDGENVAFQFGSLENDLEGDQVIFVASASSTVPLIFEDLKIQDIEMPEKAIENEENIVLLSPSPGIESDPSQNSELSSNASSSDLSLVENAEEMDLASATSSLEIATPKEGVTASSTIQADLEEDEIVTSDF